MYFEDFHKGQHYECEPITISEADILEFASRFDPLPIHIDKDFASESIYSGIIASGFHTLCAVWGQWVKQKVLSHEIIGGLSLDSVKWIAPVRPNDRLTVDAEVMDLIPSSKKGRGIFALKVTASNQEGQVVMTVESKALVKCRL